VPEFDMPGHSIAWFVGYPELASGPGPYQIERSWGIFDPAMDPTREETYRFLDAFIGEMTGIFPDEYFHIGGDEVNGAQWDRNPVIQAFKRAHNLKDNHDLQAYFNQRLQVILKKHGRKMMGWDEILHPGLPNDILVQSWRGQKSLADGAKLGYRGILSSGYYLDHLQPAAQHYGVDPLSGDASQLNEAERARILGGEACMWSEYVNAETIESRIWPRAAAVAERLWSPAELRDADSMYQRLAPVNRQLEWTGVRHRANYPPMLVRLADGYPARNLQVLSDAVEGLGIEPREKSHKYTSLTPLNRLVDAARPESEPIRAISNAIDRLLSQPGAPEADREEVRSALIAWRDNHARLLPVLEHSFLLKEAMPISEDLAKLGAIGLEALDHLQSKTAMPADWGAQQKEILDRMEKPQAEVRLAAVRPVRKLVEAAAALH
jgi:hexosaminidase